MTILFHRSTCLTALFKKIFTVSSPRVCSIIGVLSGMSSLLCDYVSFLDKTIYLIVSYSLDAFRKPLEKHDQRKKSLEIDVPSKRFCVEYGLDYRVFIHFLSCFLTMCSDFLNVGINMKLKPALCTLLMYSNVPMKIN